MELKQIVQYISYAMSVWAVLTTVWILSAKNAGKDYNVANLKNDVAKIQTEMITKYEMKIFTDSISYYNYRMEQKLNTLVKSNNNLRNSYVNYLKRDKTLKLEDFLKFMNGIEWVVSPLNNDVKVDSFKIKINKK
jgi:ABC-type tungstate transport system permease subunit